ncbi:MAG: hypothetical protein DME42_07875 [Verrucomicrobia bacterium]|nr:MAG: hypothetical protein DME42_07875 [Verrucomicrobiota bacterium]
MDLSLKTGSDLGMSWRIIQVQPSRNPRWRSKAVGSFEAEDVSPVYCGGRVRDSALSYDRQRRFAPAHLAPERVKAAGGPRKLHLSPTAILALVS